MTDLAYSERVVSDGIVLRSLPSFGLVYTVSCFVNEEVKDIAAKAANVFAHDQCSLSR